MKSSALTPTGAAESVVARRRRKRLDDVCWQPRDGEAAFGKPSAEGAGNSCLRGLHARPWKKKQKGVEEERIHLGRAFTGLLAGIRSSPARKASLEQDCLQFGFWTGQDKGDVAYPGMFIELQAPKKLSTGPGESKAMQPVNITIALLLTDEQHNQFAQRPSLPRVSQLEVLPEVPLPRFGMPCCTCPGNGNMLPWAFRQKTRLLMPSGSHIGCRAFSRI